MHLTATFDGTLVLPEKQAGMDLLERSAKAGYKHAIRRLRQEQQNQALSTVP